MINLKVSMFVLSLAAAALVGGLGTTFVINMNASEPAAVDCKPAPSGKETFRHQDPVNSGRQKEY
ncbi:hypothetical protein M1V18_004390 [Salmonella enterica]|nr:hypothetical protein [Salmonella enterica]